MQPKTLDQLVQGLRLAVILSALVAFLVGLAHAGAVSSALDAVAFVLLCTRTLFLALLLLSGVL